MRKLKYILASIVLATGFAACETEAIDEKVKDDSLPGNPILSFDLNSKQTVITDEVSVDFSGGGMSIVSKLSIVNTEDTSNPETRYKAAYLYINFSAMEIGNFPTTLSIDNPSNYLSSATLRIQELIPNEEEELEKVWIEYSTNNADENQNAGYANITHVNGTAQYMNGNFDYILYPYEEEETELSLQPQRITNGQFSYIHYE
ncbi:hypothetical protein SAMN02927937_01256 [Paenimyroides aquimaris]|uniref:Uncharacterized protein n=1 Tax=Paenimyroides marinum TaxID=1159016 RepID=A0A1H6KW71_9FLAO|nr:hypothetical protein SAMN02927937_01256 [Paenimyroides aquimaris]